MLPHLFVDRATSANYRTHAYKFLKAGSLNDVGASTWDYLRKYSGGLDSTRGAGYEEERSELWEKATVDLGKYHHEE